MLKNTVCNLLLVLLGSCTYNSNAPVSGEKINVDIHHSKSASFVHFLRTGFGEPYTSKSIKEIIEKNNIDEFNQEQNIFDFKKFWGYLLEGYNFKDAGLRHSGFYGEDALIGLSAVHSKLKDFEKGIPLLMPYKGVLAYTRLKSTFYPIFERLMWAPEALRLEGNISKLKEVMRKSDFDGLLQKVKVFYDSEYPNSIPMQLGLIPILDKRKLKRRHTSAQIIKNIQIVPYFTSKGAEGSLDVIFHEFSHALYYTQNSNTRDALNRFYLETDNEHALFIYRYLDESLATVMGNGVYKEILDKKEPQGEWYHNKYINGLAKAYFPTVKGYLAENKKMDSDFMNKTLELAKNAFPNGPYETPSNLVTINVVTVHPDIASNLFIQSIRENFRVQSYGELDNLKPDTVERLFKKKWYNLIVLSNNTDVPLKIAQHFKIKSKKLKSNALHIFRKGGMFLFWIEADSAKIISKAIEELKRIEILPRKNSVINLK